MSEHRASRSILCTADIVRVSHVGPHAAGYLFANYFRPVIVNLTGDVEHDLVFVGQGAPGMGWYVGQANRAFDLEDRFGGRQ